ncbi:MAG: hypothetical protein P8Y78_14605, partial [Acidihalobacter sp.]
MEQATIDFLAAQAHADRVRLSGELDEALRALDAEMSELAGVLQVEYVGPGVGMQDMGAEHVFRLAVRHHVWDVSEAGWGLKVCDGLPNGRGHIRVHALQEIFFGDAQAQAFDRLAEGLAIIGDGPVHRSR